MNNQIYELQDFKEYIACIASGMAGDQWQFEEFPLISQAVIHDDMELASVLLDMGADINGTDPNGYLPIMYANSKEWIDFLVNKGARLDIVNPFTRYSLLHEVVYYGNWKIIGPLVENGADMYKQFDLLGKNTPPSIAYTPPFAGMKLAPPIFVHVLEEFKQCGYDISGVEGDYSLLHGCVFTLNPVAVAWLVDNGANTAVKDSTGLTPLEYLNHLLNNQKEWMFMGYDYTTQAQMEGLLRLGSAWYDTQNKYEDLL